MLYGIPNFYPKFGYATAGPEHFIELTRLTDPAVLPAVERVAAVVLQGSAVVLRAAVRCSAPIGLLLLILVWPAKT